MWDGGGYTVSLKSHILSITGKTRKIQSKTRMHSSIICAARLPILLGGLWLSPKRGIWCDWWISCDLDLVIEGGREGVREGWPCGFYAHQSSTLKNSVSQEIRMHSSSLITAHLPIVRGAGGVTWCCNLVSEIGRWCDFVTQVEGRGIVTLSQRCIHNIQVKRRCTA